MASETVIINLRDNMSKKLESITNATNKLITRLERLHQVTNFANVGQSFTPFRNTITATTRDINWLTFAVNEASKKFNSLGSVANNHVKSVDKSFKTVRKTVDYTRMDINWLANAIREASKTMGTFGKNTNDTIKGADRQFVSLERIIDNIRDDFKWLAHSINEATKAIRGLAKANGNLANTTQRVTQNAVRGFNNSTNAANKTKKSIDSVTVSTNRARKATGMFSSTMFMSLNRGIQLYGRLRMGVLGYVSALVGSKVFTLSDKLTNISSKAKIANEPHTQGMTVEQIRVSNKQFEDDIFNSAQRIGTSFLEYGDFVTKLAIRTGDAFSGNDELLAFTETLNKMYAIAGTEAQEAAAANLQLSQALGSGRLMGDEFRSISEQAPLMLQALADYFDVSVGEVKKLASDGLITTEVMKQAMFNVKEEVERKFNEMPLTFARIFALIGNSWIKAFQPVFITLRQMANSKEFLSFMDGLAKASAYVANVMLKVFGLFGSVAKFIVKYWSILVPILSAILVPLAMHKTLMLGIATATKIATVVKSTFNFMLNLTRLAYLGLTNQIGAAIFSQQLFNTTLYACPLTWIVIAIFAVISALYIAVAAWNYFTGSAISATGIVVGAFSALGAFVANLFIGLWKVIAWFAEGLVYVFQNPVYAIQSLAFGLIISMLDAIGKLAEGWDDVWTNIFNGFVTIVNGILDGWNWLVDKLGSVGEAAGLTKANKFNHTVSIASDIENYKTDLQTKFDAIPKPAKTFVMPNTDFISVNDAWSKGYNWGDDVSKNLSLENLFSGGEISKHFNDLKKNLGIENADIGAGTVGDKNNYLDPNAAANAKKLGQIANNTADTAKNTSSDNDKDFEFLRQAAERTAINRFTTKDIKVEISNQNNISSDYDAKRFSEIVIKDLINAFKSGATNSANGSYMKLGG